MGARSGRKRTVCEMHFRLLPMRFDTRGLPKTTAPFGVAAGKPSHWFLPGYSNPSIYEPSRRKEISRLCIDLEPRL
jgi:hypothetical protein